MRFSGRRARAVVFALLVLVQPSTDTAADSGRRHAVTPPDSSRAPRVNADSYSVRRGRVLTVSASTGVLANDSDPQSKPLSAVVVSQPAHGALFLNGDGSFTYANDGGTAPADSFLYTATNTAGDSNTARVTITVAADVAPVAANDSYTTAPGTTLTIAAPGVLSNDIDADGDALAAVLVAGPQHGALTLNANGSFSYTNDGSAAASDSFTYAASDGTLESNTATVSIAVDSAVRANADTYPATQNTPRSVDAPGVLANDLVNGAKIVSFGANIGTEQTQLGGSTATTAGGTVTLNADGSLRFTPAPYFAGADTFKYRLSNNATSSTAVVLMMVFAAPSASNDSYSASSGGTTTISKPGVLSNDTLNSATITGYGASSGMEQTATGNPTPTAKGGSVTLAADGGFTYTPPKSLTGSDTFKYTIGNFAGSSPATVTIDVSASPFAVNDGYQAPANATTSITAANGVLANDTTNGAAIVSYGASAGTEQASLGASTPTAAGNKVALNSDGSFVYTPNASFSGTDSFKYKLSNAAGSSTGTVTVNVSAGPLAVNDAYAVSKNTALAVSAPGLLANDTSNNGAIVSYGAATGTEQTALGNPAPTAQGGSVSVTADGSFNYAPPPNITGTDTFKYVLANSAGRATAAVTLTISQAPIAADDSYVTVTAGVLSIAAPGVLTNDSLNGGKITTFGATGIEQSSLGTPAPTAQGGTIALNANGSFAYTPPSALLGSGAFNDGFRYVLSNSSGTVSAGVNVLVALYCPSITISPSSLPAGAPGSSYAATFTAAGGSGALTWSVIGGLPAGLSLSASGVLSGTPTLAGSYSITIKAADANGCTGTATLSLFVSCPTIYITPSTSSGPGVLPAGTTSTAYSAVTFSQSGGTAPVAFGVTGGSLPPGLSLSSAGALSGTPTVAGTYTFSVTATDANGCSASLPLALTVNAKCPAIAIAPPPLFPAGLAGQPYAGVSFSQTGGTAPVTWTSGTLPTGMTFSTAGVLAGTPSQKGSFGITVIATDANGCTATRAVTFDVNCPAVVVSPATIAAATSGAVYSAAFSQTGGVAPIAFDLASGALPTGITLSSAGVLSGTTTQTGTFAFAVRATDSNGCTGVQALSLTVNAKCPALDIAPVSLPPASLGVSYNALPFTLTGGAAPVTWSAGALPPGMSFSTAGVLSGTPASGGVFNLTVTATDANACGKTVSLPFAVNTTCPAITANPSTLAPAQAGTAYPSVTFSSAGGVGTMTWSLAGGTFPAGMTFSAGVLSGTPTTAGSYAFTVKVTDANGCFGTRDLTLTVNPKCGAFSILPPALAAGTAGSAYPAVSFAQSGGTAPITWSAGALPGGMTFSTAGVLSGTPTVRGTFNLSVQATDANGCTATLAASLVIGCPTITVLPVTLSAGTVGTAFGNVTLAQTGGVAPVTWNVTTGSLPPGMSLTTAGVLSGTPTVAGASTFTVTATDANGCTASRALTLNVNPVCPTIDITPLTLPTAFLGVSYGAFNLTQTGGAGLVTWSSSALPTGMSFSTAGVLSGTPSVLGSYNLSVQATDANGCTGTRTYTFTVTCQSMTISLTSLPPGIINSPYSATFAQVGGVTPITWSISSGSLPPGLSFASTTGTLSGIPTATGSYSFTVKATASNGCVATQPITLVINCQSITIAPSSLSNGFTGLAYTAVTFTQLGATAPVSWSATGLPAGLSLSSGGVLSGTPTASGTFGSVIVTLTDAAGCVQTRTYSLIISTCSVSVTNPAGTSASTTNTITKTFTQSGGTSPVSFKMITSLLYFGLNNPSGVTLESDGNIYVADTDNDRIVKFSSYTGLWSVIVTGLLQPQGVAIDETNHYIYIADTGNSAIKRTNLSGGSLTTILSAANGLNHPAGIAVDSSSNVIIADTSNNAIKKYNGSVLTTVASGLNNPAGVTVDSGGNIYIADTGNNAVKKYTGSLTTLVSSGLSSPTGVAVDSSGNVYIADRGSNSVKMWNGALSTAASFFATPQGIAVDSLGRPYVAETGSDSIRLIGTPPGLTLSSAGVLSGVPTLAGTFPMRAIVTDANGCTGTSSSTYDLAVSCSLSVTGPSVIGGIVLIPIVEQYTAGSVTGTGVWSASNLPPGLSLGSNTGILTGVPSQSGTYTATITVSDSAGCSKSITTSFTIGCFGLTCSF